MHSRPQPSFARTTRTAPPGTTLGAICYLYFACQAERADTAASDGAHLLTSWLPTTLPPCRLMRSTSGSKMRSLTEPCASSNSCLHTWRDIRRYNLNMPTRKRPRKTEAVCVHLRYALQPAGLL